MTAVQTGATRKLCGGERPVEGQRSEQALLQPDADSAEIKAPATGAVKARGHFPTEQAAMKCLCLVTRSLDPEGTGGLCGGSQP